MATSSVSSSTNTISALGAGSGVDVKTLAQSLVDAEKSPRKSVIDAKIKKSEGGISGYSAVKFVLNDLKTAFSNLKDLSDFNTIIPKNSQSSAFTVTANSSASSGSHTVNVTALAKAQRNITAGFADTASSVNGGAAFSFTLTKGTGASQTTTTMNIAAADTTPQGIVSTINAYKAGVTAQLVNTGDATAPFKIVVTGATGASNAFSLTSLKQGAGGGEVTGVSFGNKLQSAVDATFNVNGMDMTSSKNTVTDAIAGATLNLTATTTTNVPANLVFSRDTSSITTKLNALVTAYNDANTMLGVVSDPKSTVETYGATLVGNSIVGSVRSQMRQLISSNSTTPGGELNALRDIGFTLDQKGVLSIDKTKLDTKLKNNFDNVVTLVTGNRENQSNFSVLPSGVAGEAVKKLTALLDTAAPLTTQSTNLTTKISAYKKQLADLDTRMSSLLARYNKQFATMESMVGQSKSLQTNLKSTFDGMMSVYTNK